MGIGGRDIGKVREIGEAGGNIFRDMGTEPGQDIFIPHSIATLTGG